MVKGILLKSIPCMNLYTESDILADLDLVNEINMKSLEGSGLSNYIGDRFEIHLMKESTQGTKYSLFEVLSILQEAVPELIRTFLYEDDYVLLAFLILTHIQENINNIYSEIVDELLRFTTFALTIPEWSREEAIFRVRQYVNLFIKWPGKE